VTLQTKILDFVKRTQKALGALAGATGVLASATFLPAPWGSYVAIAGVILTWALTYLLPYVQKAVEGFPEDQPVDQLDDAPEPVQETPVTPVAPVTGVIVEPPTVEYAAVTVDTPEPTIGIPVIEGDDASDIPTGRLSVDAILSRLTAEAGASTPA
jgi:hypothetical protein